MKFLVTGNAGFIGYHVAARLLERGNEVVGFDVVNDYYDPELKEARLKLLQDTAERTGSAYTFIRADLTDRNRVAAAFEDHLFDRVIHLAAQAGVRYSLENPQAYLEANLQGFLNVIECCRLHKTPHLTYASTSSVYGGNTNMPFSEHRGVDHPLQLYAATKRANELMAHAYSHLFRLPTTGLRFFTVYGPWGRPDMALFLFTRNILEGRPITVFNHGNHTRDFTFIDDIAEGVIRAADKVAEPNAEWNSAAPDPATSNAPFRIFNIGAQTPVKLSEYIEAIEEAVDRKAKLQLLPLQPGDVPETYADTTELFQATGFRPKTTVRQGVARFVEWYRDYHRI